MDKKTKILFFVIVLISTLSIVATYYRYVELNDFETYTLEDETADGFEDVIETEDQI